MENRYYTIKPPANLEKIIRFFWVIVGSATPTQPYIHRSMAEISPQLFFQYEGGWDEITDQQMNNTNIEIYKYGLTGPSSRVYRYSTTNNFGIIGAYLYPYAVPCLFNIATTDLINRSLGLEMLIGKESGELKEKIHSKTDNHDKLSVISEYLDKKPKFPMDTGMVSSIRLILRSKGEVDIPKLASNLSLSRRQFERKFKSLTGFSPKKFCRIVRFNHLIGANTKFDSLTEMAYAFGYYDQSHFIHEFKEFSGYHPKIYFSGQANEAFYTT